MYNQAGLTLSETVLLTLWTRAEGWSREDEGELLHGCLRDPASRAYYVQRAEQWEKLQRWYQTDPTT